MGIKMSEKLEKWLKNEDFEKERQEYARNLIHTENLLDKYMEYAHNLTVEERSNFIQKCIDKYESDVYRDREYAMGAGFVVALSRRWKSPENEYRKWHREQSYTDSNYSNCIFQLGKIQEVAVTDDISVINMIAQHNCSWMRDVNSKMIPPIRYGALERCLNKVADLELKNNTSVHMPKIGAGLAGGNWNRIEKIIEKTLVDKGIDVTVYLFDK